MAKGGKFEVKTVWKWVILICGPLLILGLGVLAGAIILAGVGSGYRGGGVTASGGGKGAAVRPAGTKAGKSEKKSKLLGRYGKAAETIGYENAADALNIRTTKTTSYAFGAVNGAGEAVLPPFLARLLPWGMDYGTVKARSAANSQAEKALGGRLKSNGFSPDVETGRVEVKSGPQPFSSGQNQGQGGGVGRSVMASDGGQTGAWSATHYYGTGTVWVLEFGHFVLPYNARLFSRSLNRQGIVSIVRPEMGSDGREWYSVRSGVFPTEQSAEAQAERLRRQGFVAMLVGQSGGE